MNNNKGFVYQIDVFASYEEAEAFAEGFNELLDDEYLNIIFIDYDEDENEIGCGTVC